MVPVLRRAALSVPIYRQDAVCVNGPDQDSFTMSIEALEAVLDEDSRPGLGGPGRLTVIGELPNGSEELIRGAIGSAELTIQRRPGGRTELFRVLRDPEPPPPTPSGWSAIVVLDSARMSSPGLPRPAHGDAAAAVSIGEGPGVEIIAAGEEPDVLRNPKAFLAAVRESTGEALGGSPATWLIVTDEPSTALVSHLRDSSVGARVAVRTSDMKGLGRPPTISALAALWEVAASLLPGGYGVLAVVENSVGEYLGVRSTAPAKWIGPWGGATGFTMELPEVRPHVAASLDSVSQGAYVPRPTYLEGRASHWRMEADRCSSCAHLTFPVRGACRSCGSSQGLVRERLPRRGLRVEAVTTISEGAQPTEFDSQVRSSGPYDVVIARVAEEVRTTHQAVDSVPGTIKVDDYVTLRLRRLYPMEGEWRYGLKAVRDLPES